MADGQIGSRLAELHAKAIIVNGCSPSRKLSAAFEGFVAGGIAASVLTVANNEDFGPALDRLQVTRSAVAEFRSEQGSIRIAVSVDDICNAKREHASAVVIGFQNARPIGYDVNRLSLFHRLGLRVLQLTYQRRNPLADGCGESGDVGLSILGREAVAVCNSLGILIDLSHTGHRSTMETIEASRAPVTFTHTSLSAFNPNPRNKTDEEIRFLASKGGVVGLMALSRLATLNGRTEGTTVDDYVRQIDHVVDLVGIGHVGLGLDITEGLTRDDFAQRRATFLKEFPELQAGGDFAFDHYYTQGLSTSANVALITQELIRHGYADADILKILGGNFLRVFGQVWPGLKGGNEVEHTAGGRI